MAAVCMAGWVLWVALVVIRNLPTALDCQCGCGCAYLFGLTSAPQHQKEVVRQGTTAVEYAYRYSDLDVD